MKHVKIVIGSNFGDEGKGITTDYYCQKWSDKKILNVRFNGGSQAGHTVVHNGKRHVFHNFGAGSFNKNVATFLSHFYYLDIISFLKEKEELEKMGIKPFVILSSNLNIILPYDIIINQLVELSRGNNRHGSCGYGIWECLNRSKDYQLTPQMIKYTKTSALKEKILFLRDNYYKNRLAEYNLNLTEEYENIWNDEDIIDNFIIDAKNVVFNTFVSADLATLNSFDYQVYEGAQGLLLDWDNREYFPNLTASYTGLKNVEELLSMISDEIDKEICYVTRTYFTRHGAGKFVTETQKENLRYAVNDKTNVFNDWQQSFRWGFFDLSLFIKTIKKDLTLATGNYKLSLSVTHCDETNNNFVLPEQDLNVAEIKNYLPVDNLMLFKNEATQL